MELLTLWSTSGQGTVRHWLHVDGTVFASDNTDHFFRRPAHEAWIQVSLKPKGDVELIDVRNIDEYAAALQQQQEDRTTRALRQQQRTQEHHQQQHTTTPQTPRASTSTTNNNLPGAAATTTTNSATVEDGATGAATRSAANSSENTTRHERTEAVKRNTAHATEGNEARRRHGD
mmetsp:Transcript_30126/g.62066  ORF Transcript_30126/g.62066 Transcript_30126/m.62066 type:complete len:175 (-) Transcript_30126:692-1216(-)